MLSAGLGIARTYPDRTAQTFYRCSDSFSPFQLSVLPWTDFSGTKSSSSPWRRWPHRTCIHIANGKTITKHLPSLPPPSYLGKNLDPNLMWSIGFQTVTSEPESPRSCWKHVRHEDSWVPSSTYRIRICGHAVGPSISAVMSPPWLWWWPILQVNLYYLPECPKTKRHFSLSLKESMTTLV